jgi:hypothetical protein
VYNRNKISSLLLQWDVKQEKRKDYNRFAMGIYLQALDRVEEDFFDGMTLRQALEENFTGRLLDFLLKNTK